jgi:hypothetical protein
VAKLPEPIGVGAILTDIAGGLGVAARKVAQDSRSELGALAIKGAKVDIEFEMASRRNTDGASAGLGMRSFSFGFGVNREAVDERRINRGRIELEIVAVPLAAAAGEVPSQPVVVEPAATPDSGARMRAALAALHTDLEQRKIPARARAEIEKRLAGISKQLDRGDLTAATAGLLALQPILAALPGGGG